MVAPGESFKGREPITVQGIFGSFELLRDYYHHAGKKRGHCPADAALGLEGGYTPALSRLICLEGADTSLDAFRIRVGAPGEERPEVAEVNFEADLSTHGLLSTARYSSPDLFDCLPQGGDCSKEPVSGL